MTALRPSRRSVLASAAAVAASPGLARAAASRERDWHGLAGDVRAEMTWAWDNYHARAWGKDQIKPISGGYESFPLKDHHLGLSLVEGLGTLWLMGLDDQFNAGVSWLKANLDFDVDGEVSVFETSIRFLGGLLSAHLACGDPFLLQKSHDLADRLLPAFQTKTGMPHRFVNLRTGATRNAHTGPAEVGTFLPEWGTLSRLVSDRRYYDTAKRSTVALYDRRSSIDLIGDAIDADTGEWLGNRCSVGSGTDSYFEYLWDGWQLFGDADCRRMFDTLTRSVLKYQTDVQDGRLWIADADFRTGEKLSKDQDELASFYGGLLGQGGWMKEGEAYTNSWAWLQDRYGVLPGGFNYGSDTVTDKGNYLFPELADSAFNLWLLNRDTHWREVGRTHFLNMKRWSKAPYGYATLSDVTVDPKVQSDHCPGFWWAEQMKYYYLLFSDTPRFDYRQNYLSTEGAVLQGFRKA